jgi:type VII secretion integral membrane protein EccD
MNTTGLVRVTVVAPNRRIDLALPERSPVAEILPGLLARAGDRLADQGADAGGWVLRRADGSVLDTARTLTTHRVLDGEILHLTPARTDWPELEYDDLVDAIASGSARAGGTWSPRHTRWAGLAAGALMTSLCLLTVLRAGPPWPGPAMWALGAAALLLATAVVAARIAGDAGAGAMLAAIALPFAFTGGGLIFAGDRGLLALGAPHLLAASAALMLAGMVGLFGVVDRSALFTGAAAAGLLGVVGAWLANTGSITGYGAAAVIAGAGLAFSPMLARLSIRLARVPMPVLPRGTADLLRDEPQPPRAAVYATVLRADALLTGLVGGLAVATVPCEVLLIRGGGTSGLILVVVLTLGFGLRARLYPVTRHRVALLVAAAAGAVCLAAGPLMAERANLLSTAGPVLLVLGAVVTLAGLRHSKHKPNPYLPRAAELLEVLVVLAVVPVVCSVLGLFGLLRGLAG